MGRTISRVVAGLAVVSTLAVAQPPIPERPDGLTIRNESYRPLLRRSDGQGEPWLGVSVHKPSRALYERLEKIPKAVGFVVNKVAPEGPAAEAGLRQADFLWKFNDQILVNEAQFLVLLHLHNAGDTVRMTYQRDGENHEVDVVLTTPPSSDQGREEADLAVMSDPPIPGFPSQFVDLLRQSAEIKDPSGVIVRLERERSGEGFRWQQIDASGRVTLQGPVLGVDSIPEGTDTALAKKLRALIRAYEDAELRAKTGVRSSRVRRVPKDEPSEARNP